MNIQEELGNDKMNVTIYHNFKYLIRNYDNIRHILREIYLYGCFTKDVFIQKGMSARKYDMEKKRLFAYLPADLVKERRQGKKLVLYCAYDYTHARQNGLADTYFYKTCTIQDIIAYFYVQQLLSDDNEKTTSGLVRAIQLKTAQIGEFNIGKKLGELQKTGLIEERKRGKSNVYTLSKDIWEDFEKEELQQIIGYLEILKNIMYLEMPYHFLQKKLRLYLYAKYGVWEERQNCFQYCHRHLEKVLDEEITLLLLRAIYQKQSVNIQLMGKSEGRIYMPIKIRFDVNYGSQVVLAIDRQTGKETVIPIESIVKTKIPKER